MLGKIIILGVLIVVVIAGVAFYNQNAKHATTAQVTVSASPVATKSPVSFDFGDQTITLDNQQVMLMNGAYSGADQHTTNISSSTTSGSGTRGVAILVDQPGGSGTFYYVIGGMIKDGKQIYSTPVLLGDRIKIVSATVDDPGAHDSGMITVQYMDRAANAPMSAEPTEQVTKMFSFQDDGNLISTLH